jgi:hypothetical protein
LKSIFSYLCGLISAIATFLLCVFACNYFDRLTGGHFSRFWTVLSYIAGLILGLIVSGVVKNLIHKEPTVFH